jgi:hypothetical protein
MSIYSLDAADLADVSQILVDMLEQHGKACRLHYLPKMVDCAECSGRVAIGKQTKNVWKHGGPSPMSANVCSSCGGNGKRAQEVTENIKLVVDFNSKENWFGYNKALPKNPTVTLPYGIIQTRGYIYDLPKVLKCVEMELQLPLQGIVYARYKLLNSPTDYYGVVQDKFFVGTWERIA